MYKKYLKIIILLIFIMCILTGCTVPDEYNEYFIYGSIFIGILIIAVSFLLYKHKLNKIVPVGILLGVQGQYSGQTFQIKDGQEIVMGRDAALAHIVFEDHYNSISRRHCSLRYNGKNKTYILVDFSENGVFSKDGKRYAQNRQIIMSDNEHICLGNMENIFKIG